jgi:WS/DGAT/MGAT family acyltransferase
MKRLSLLDLGFFITETEENPKHVAGLMVFKRPAGSRADFAARLYQELQASGAPMEPFNQVIDFWALTGPSWRPAGSFDIDEHLHFHKPRRTLKKPDLYALVAGLHTPPLDRSRPLWEFHIIDRVEGGRFAIYSKTHHAYADGVTLSSWMARSLSDSAEDQSLRPVWRLERGRRRSRRVSNETATRMLKRFIHGSVGQIRASGGLAKLMTQLTLERVGLTKHAVSLPFRSDGRSPLTGQITAERQFAKASVPMADVQRIREMCRATLNHVALTCVDGALHRFLQATGQDIHRPIAIQMPVSLRSGDDAHLGNRIGLVTVDLANRTDDPYLRLREIGFTLRNVRNQIDGVPPDAVVQYTIIMGVAAQLMEMLKLNNVLPPISDTLVSNVPGPRQPLYLKGARMEEMCPMSTLMPGNHLNITLYSYAWTLHFGLIGTREIGDLARLASYIEQAFRDLETAVFNPPDKLAKR